MSLGMTENQSQDQVKEKKKLQLVIMPSNTEHNTRATYRLKKPL